MLAQGLAKLWQQTVIVDNVPGAHTSLGVKQVVRAAPTGYTLLSSGDQLAVNAALGRKLPLQRNRCPRRDPHYRQFTGPGAASGTGHHPFRGICCAVKATAGRSVHGAAHRPWQHLSSGRRVTQPASGHVHQQHPPYAGGAPAFLDILGGHVDGALIDISSATQDVQARKLVPLAVTSTVRSKVLPGIASDLSGTGRA